MIADYLLYNCPSGSDHSSIPSSCHSASSYGSCGSSIASSNYSCITPDQNIPSIARMLREEEQRGQREQREQLYRRQTFIESAVPQYAPNYQPQEQHRVQAPAPQPGRPNGFSTDLWAVPGARPPVDPQFPGLPHRGTNVYTYASAQPPTIVEPQPTMAPPCNISRPMAPFVHTPAPDSFVPTFAPNTFTMPEPQQPPVQQPPQAVHSPPQPVQSPPQQQTALAEPMDTDPFVSEAASVAEDEDSDCESSTTMPSCRLHARLRKTRLRPEGTLVTGKRKYRCEMCTMTLEAWVQNNGTNPDSPHKTELLKVVGMTRKQLNYWFANRRRMERQAAKDSTRARVPVDDRSVFQTCGSETASTDVLGSWSLGESGFLGQSNGLMGSNSSFTQPQTQPLYM